MPRHDYNPHTGELIVRMTTPTHDIFTAQVVNDIKSQLEQIGASDHPLAAVARSVAFCSTSRIYLEGDPSDDQKLPTRSPDASFLPGEAKYPSIVIEISYS
jgi:hypothetical protein